MRYMSIRDIAIVGVRENGIWSERDASDNLLRMWGTV